MSPSRRTSWRAVESCMELSTEQENENEMKWNERTKREWAKRNRKSNEKNGWEALLSRRACGFEPSESAYLEMVIEASGKSREAGAQDTARGAMDRLFTGKERKHPLRPLKNTWNMNAATCRLGGIRHIRRQVCGQRKARLWQLVQVRVTVSRRTKVAGSILRLLLLVGRHVQRRRAGPPSLQLTPRWLSGRPGSRCPPAP